MGQEKEWKREAKAQAGRGCRRGRIQKSEIGIQKKTLTPALSRRTGRGRKRRRIWGKARRKRGCRRGRIQKSEIGIQKKTLTPALSRRTGRGRKRRRIWGKAGRKRGWRRGMWGRPMRICGGATRM